MHFELSTLNRRGILPKKGESREDFFKRATVLAKKAAPMEAALARCKCLFDVEPDWVEMLEEQKGLAPWQGAVMWIREDSQGHTSPLIQISPRLKHLFLRKWYAQEEVIAHELIHAVRLPLHSLRFEEIIAYHTSQNPLRRYLGPLIRCPYEVYILLASVILAWAGLFWGVLSFFMYIPWVVCLCGVMRLVYFQGVFHRCKAKLSGLLKDKDEALALLARLTDEEILFFSKSSEQDILTYATKMKEKQMRWEMLCAAYAFRT